MAMQQMLVALDVTTERKAVQIGVLAVLIMQPVAAEPVEYTSRILRAKVPDDALRMVHQEAADQI